MNEQEKQYFSELVRRRTQLSEMLLMDEAKGLLGAVMNKYSDQAHFVYELIQNADDAQATEAEFILYKDRLIFKHNGKRHFSLSNPSTQEIDKKKGKLGDLNAITSYASSSKENDEKSKIGKFGLGFKSVFVYSSNPHIYDSNICFSLDSRQIVPIQIEDDFPGRKDNETVFVLPFDNPEIAFDNISAKLESLKFPTLFLNGLRWIKYKTEDGREGIYSRKPYFSKKIDGTDISFYKIRNGEKDNTAKIYLFSRSFDYEGKPLSYSCGFMADKFGNLIPCKYDAFCYFETFETTNLKFIIHAPFLLSDNRHNILAANKHNESLIDRLASLAADSLVFLRDIGIEQNKRIIDDSILKVIPFRDDPDTFAPIGDRDRVSFLPFYNEIKRVMTSEKILPARNIYVSSEEAFWADTEEMTRLFTDEQLSYLFGETRYFVFTSLGRNTTSHNAEDGLADYIDDITKDYVDLSEIFQLWNASFTESQPLTWLFNFYQAILEARGRTNLLSRLKNIPIFLTDSGTASAAFDSNGNEILFLPDKGTEEYATIHPQILENKYGRQLACDGFHLRTPDLQDRIFNKILSKDKLDPVNDFCIFLDYYIECLENGLPFDDLANELSDRKFITSYYLADHSSSIENPAFIYYPSPELLNYFDGTNDDVYFFDLNSYSKYLSQKQALHLDSFIDALNIDRRVAVRTQTFDSSSFDKQAYNRYKWQRSTQAPTWEVKWVDSITTVIPRIIDNNDFDLSVFLWNSIIHILEDNSNGLKSIHYYSFRGPKAELFISNENMLLKSEKWIIGKDGVLHSAKELYIQDLYSKYETDSIEAKKLLQFLEIEDAHPEYQGMDPETVDKLRIYEQLEKAGFSGSDEEIQAFIKFKENEQLQNRQHEEISGSSENTATNSTEHFMDDMKERMKEKNKRPSTSSYRQENTDSVSDSDEYTKASLNIQKKLDQTKQKYSAELLHLHEIELLQQEKEQFQKYSYGWFRTLLKLETLTSNSDNLQNRQVSISFGSIEREPGTSRTFILSKPNRSLPSVLEELSDINMELSLADGSQTKLVIDAASIKSYSLRVKVKETNALQNLDINSVTDIFISAKSPDFLLNELMKQFDMLSEPPFKISDDFNMQMNLPENIRFIFGPPGTGKTTYLANKIIVPTIQNNKNVKILVLAPTNKAADVLVRKIMSRSDCEYEKWLVRHGATADEEIENSVIYKGRETDITSYEKIALVTTVQRFPYDYLIGVDNQRRDLHRINWDYIVVDEASMIQLIYLIDILYLKTPTQFVIAGDPFQIEPPTSISDWKNENIYTLVNLNKTLICRRVVKEVFNTLYNGVVRERDTRKFLGID